MPNKVCLVGRAGVGKTSLIKVVFGGVVPEDILNEPPAPTRGIVSNVNHWVDLELGIFDTSGQELKELMEDIEEQTNLFEGADGVLYVVDYDTWVAQKQEVVKEIRQIYRIVKKIRGATKFYIVFHKADKLGYQIEGIFDLVEKNINLRLAMPFKVHVFFTSIREDLVFSAYNMFADVLTSFSNKMMLLKTKIDQLIRFKTQSICFITSKANDKIVLESMSEDFDMNIIFLLYRRASVLSRTDRIDKIDKKGTYKVGHKKFNLSIGELANKDSELKRILLLSMELEKPELENTLKKIISFIK